MKKLIYFILSLTFSLFATSCVGDNNEPEQPESPPSDDESAILDLYSNDYALVVNSFKLDELDIALELIGSLKTDADLKIDRVDFTKPAREYEILFGSVMTRDEVSSVVSELRGLTLSDTDAYAVVAGEKKIVVTATSTEALALAKNELLSLIKNSKLQIPKDYKSIMVFNKQNPEIRYTPDELSKTADLASIKVMGEEVSGFIPSNYSYTADYNAAEDYPLIIANPASPDATVRITQAKDNLGVAKIEVKAKEGGEKKEYTVAFSFGNGMTVTSEVVNKDGRHATLSFVVDDGDQLTADIFATNILPKYSDVRMTFAIMTKKIATMHLSEDGYEWQKRPDGTYLTTPIKNTYTSEISGSKFKKALQPYVYDFWLEMKKLGRIELASHSHTHSDWGFSDEATVVDGVPVFPNNNIYKELKAPVEILSEYCGERSLSYIRPGVGDCSAADYYKDLIVSSGIYISARGSKTVPWKLESMVNHANVLSDVAKRYEVMSYAVEHYNGKLNEETSLISDYAVEEFSPSSVCLNVGIPLWTGYMDQAVKDSGWACFLIHDVVFDETVSNKKHFIYESQADLMLKHAQTLYDSGDAWIATYSEAAMYYNEWSTAEVDARIYGDSEIRVKISDGENDGIYDMPLTVKVKVPKSWSEASVGDSTLTVHTDENGTKYVYVNVIPDKETVTIKKA